MEQTQKGNRGFTLIDLIVTMLVLVVLAMTVIPVYQNLMQNANDSAAKAALGEMRAAIRAYSAREIAEGRASRFGTGTAGGLPTVAQVDDIKYSPGNSPPKVLPDGDAPINPYAKAVFSQNFDRVNAHGGPFGTTTAASGGWNYNAATGEIWANTNVHGENYY